ncbi:MAG: saccharopine dehydrogenase C-terminal domain-containing protein [Rhodocyclaceae bacterium]
MVMVGFGSIGQGVLPLLLRHLELRPEQIAVITGDEDGRELAAQYGVGFLVAPLDPGNYRELLAPRLAPGDFLINVANDVASAALITLCRERGALYIDTCIEPWAGGYTDAGASPGERTNYALREAALALRRGHSSGRGPTAILTHGANPGLISHLAKQALLDLATGTGCPADAPRDRQGWARLARDLGVKVIHVAERDTQFAQPRKAPGEFVNTWSVDGFVGEACQPAELGWGTHERHFPPDGHRHETGCRSAIYLDRPGAATRVRTWTPLAGPMRAFLITHGESISLSDYLTLGPPEAPEYRPTVHYAYHPSDDTVLSVDELAARNWAPPERKRVCKDELVSGHDELGVLLMGHARGAYWYGSRLAVAEARRLAPHNSATSLQVTAPLLAGVVWALRNPEEGIVEPEQLDWQLILEISRPYLGELVGAYTDWTPLAGRGCLFPEPVDASDPWQFVNFRVS